ncbi:MAG: hypothetical protein A3G33_01430 [Omnitrophica bacterium RIFCSPLOWO2_12_FULL_44_17]|uniref:Glycosyl hydrolase-like 10 domain-containing protein n=1 Tax=Candidatus Danuiimicrobium aquiferis TaxID=1801832 RepID=A0A1G1L1Q0_9BACT|nr:MAG: hypothetical protein A3B72_00660 [Omnitrophica bacterium RIFCSPHIGHO2_02_FULL_45_28]OGW92102.1 MAG: hypothetical protein A3E74_01535 [Omnitrophica bacterium RIFCSPHIGHO2_12_FULL_44_12]OGW99064.1 MAG: hypothetical protein A3G33_01430 [Omnitrophica bacterium RIFCSPLOWO2_12_FULL_44_17]OGX04137.1 MAG: hypothetical protein A3J12_11080 [Omnitrophica bacterium RIFCSPLOWO2_02_FULL_44_11]
MKKPIIIIYLLWMLFVFAVTVKCENLTSNSAALIRQNAEISSVEAKPLQRGLFVSVVENEIVLSSRERTNNLIDFAKKAHIQTLFVQIYRANKAWFPSKVGDSKPYKICLKKVSEDPFRLLIKEAHASGIEVHAWLNLLSLSQNEKAPLLGKYGTDILTRNVDKKRKLKDYKIDNQYFLEPGDLRVREELGKMVEEILRAYPELDGIQFDYIRYPDSNPHYGYTKMNVKRFQKATGLKTIEENSLIWKNWRREQVTDLLKLLVQKTRAIRPDIQISTTGCMSYVRAYHEAYQDWPGWLQTGLVDFVTIMSYPPTLSEFEKYISDARKRVDDFKKVNIGIGAYKLINSPGIFAEQFQFCEKAGGRSCVVFYYGSLLQNSALVNPLTGSEDI